MRRIFSAATLLRLKSGAKVGIKKGAREKRTPYVNECQKMSKLCHQKSNFTSKKVKKSQAVVCSVPH